MTREQRRFSVIILVFATLLWPITVPFSYLELLKSQQKIIDGADINVINDTRTDREHRSANSSFGKENYSDDQLGDSSRVFKKV